MKLKPRIKVVLAEKDVKQVEIAKYYLEQTGEEVTPKRVKSISNTISRYAKGEFNPSVLMLFYYMEKYLDCRLSDLFTPEKE
jgi:hypothetical protein